MGEQDFDFELCIITATPCTDKSLRLQVEPFSMFYDRREYEGQRVLYLEPHEIKALRDYMSAYLESIKDES